MRQGEWKDKAKEWREELPRVMLWSEVPIERRMTPEMVLDFRGEYGVEESNVLRERLKMLGCHMAIDYGSRWGMRYGVYAPCGSKTADEYQQFCPKHGGKKKEKLKAKPRWVIRSESQIKRTKLKIEELNAEIDLLKNELSVLEEAVKDYIT